MQNGKTTSVGGFDGDRFGRHPNDAQIDLEYEALASMPPDEAQAEIHRQAKAKYARDFDAGADRQVAAAEAAYHQEQIVRRRAERDGWDNYQATSKLVEQVAIGPIEITWEKFPELIQLAFHGAVFSGLLGAEVTNGTMLVGASGSAFAGSTLSSACLSASFIIAILAWAHSCYHKAAEALRQSIVDRLRQHGKWAVGLGIVTFGLVFGGSHAPVDNSSYGGGESSGVFAFQFFSCVSLLLLMIGLFSTELSLASVMQKLRPTIAQVGQGFQLAKSELKQLDQDILRATRAKAHCEAIVDFHQQAVVRESRDPTLAVAMKRELRKRKQHAAKQAFESGVAELKRKYVDEVNS